MKEQIKNITQKLKEISLRTPSKIEDPKKLEKVVRKMIKPPKKEKTKKEKIVKKVKALLQK